MQGERGEKGTVHLSAQTEQSLLNKATCYLQVFALPQKGLSFTSPIPQTLKIKPNPQK